jgi:hypothetical protein
MKNRLLALAFLALGSFAFAADVTGTWKTEFDSPVGTQKYTYTLKQDGKTVTGKVAGEIGGEKHEVDVKDGKIDGDAISFVEMLSFQGNEIRVAYTGKVAGDEIKFSREVGDFGKEDFVAKREPAAAAKPSAPAAPAAKK